MNQTRIIFLSIVAGMDSFEWKSGRGDGGPQLYFAVMINDIAVPDDYPVKIPSEDRG